LNWERGLPHIYYCMFRERGKSHIPAEKKTKNCTGKKKKPIHPSGKGRKMLVKGPVKKRRQRSIMKREGKRDFIPTLGEGKEGVSAETIVLGGGPE